MPSLSARDFTEVRGAGSYRPVYREDSQNHCPGCSRMQWLVGRFSAECAFCGTALPLKVGSTRYAYAHSGKPVFVTRRGRKAGRRNAARR